MVGLPDVVDGDCASGSGHPDRGAGEPADEVLAQQVQQGDRMALERLVRRYIRPLHAVAASYLPEQADIEDVVQEAFLRAVDRIASYQPARPFAPWLYQIARNVARDYLARNARRRAEPLHVAEAREGAPSPDGQMERVETYQLVDAAARALPEQQRTAFRLHDVEGYTANEIAGIMGVSSGTIRSHVHHARRALRRILADKLGEPKNAGGRQ